MWRELVLLGKTQAARRVDGDGRGERRVLRGQREQEHLRAAAHDHRVHRRLLRQGRPQRPARQDRRHRRHVQDGAHAPTPSRSSAASPTDEQRELAHKVDQFYDTFLDRVSQGRGMTKAEVDAVGRGRVWMGQQAIEQHLIDHLGGLRDALAAARAAANLPDDAPIVESPTTRRVAAREGDRARRRAWRRRPGGSRDRAAPARPSAASRAPWRRWWSTGATSRSRAWNGSTPASGARRARDASRGRRECRAPQAARSVRIATSGGTPSRIGGPVVPRPGCT